MTRWLRRWWNRSPRASALDTPRRTRLNLEPMEAREVPAALAGNGIALPLYTGSTDTAVEVVNAANNATTLYKSFPGLRTPVVAAAGDVNGDGISDAIVGFQNANGLVAVFDGAGGSLLSAAFLFPGARNVSVGAGDVNGDGFAEALVSANVPGTPVAALDIHNGGVAGFFTLPGYTGPVSLTGADTNGDGRDEIVVGLGGPSLGGLVGAFGPYGSLLGVTDVFPAFPGFNGGVSVAAGDLNGDGRDDIVVGAGAGFPSTLVREYSGADGSLLGSFVPFSGRVTTGVSVFVGDGDGDGKPDIFVALQAGYPALVAYLGATGRFLPGFGGGGGDGTYSGYDTSSGGNFDDGSSYSGGYYPDPTAYTPTPDPTVPDSSSGSTDSGGYTDPGDCSCGNYSGGDYSGGDYYSDTDF